MLKEGFPWTAGKKRAREEADPVTEKKESDTEKQETVEVVKEAGEDAKTLVVEVAWEDAKTPVAEEPCEDAKTPVAKEHGEEVKGETNASDSVPNSQEDEPVGTQLYEGCTRSGSICARTLSE